MLILTINWRAAAPDSGVNRSKSQRCKAMRELIQLDRALDVVSPVIKPATARLPETAGLRLTGSARQRDQRSEGRGERS
jgi:hypothetical protein